MYLTLVVCDLTAIRAALACVVLIGRILLLLAALRRRRAAVRNARGLLRPFGTATEQAVSRLIAAAQLAAAALAILEWLYTTGITL